MYGKHKLQVRTRISESGLVFKWRLVEVWVQYPASFKVGNKDFLVIDEKEGEKSKKERGNLLSAQLRLL